MRHFDNRSDPGRVRKDYVRCVFCGAHYNAQRGHNCK